MDADATRPIALSISTLHRADGLSLVLESLARQRVAGAVPDLVAVVVNNDPSDPAPRRVAAEIAERTGLAIEVFDEPKRGIAPPRNRGLAAAIEIAGEQRTRRIHRRRRGGARGLARGTPSREARLRRRDRDRPGRTGLRVAAACVDRTGPLLRPNPPADRHASPLGLHQQHPLRRLAAEATRPLVRRFVPAAWRGSPLLPAPRPERRKDRLGRRRAGPRAHPAARANERWLVERLRTVGRCVPIIERDLDGSLRAAVVCGVKGLVWIPLGLATSAAGAFGGKAMRVRGRMWSAYGTGLLEGVCSPSRAGRPAVPDR